VREEVEKEEKEVGIKREKERKENRGNKSM